MTRGPRGQEQAPFSSARRVPRGKPEPSGARSAPRLGSRAARRALAVAGACPGLRGPSPPPPPPLPPASRAPPAPGTGRPTTSRDQDSARALDRDGSWPSPTERGRIALGGRRTRREKSTAGQLSRGCAGSALPAAPGDSFQAHGHSSALVLKAATCSGICCFLGGQAALHTSGSQAHLARTTSSAGPPPQTSGTGGPACSPGGLLENYRWCLYTRPGFLTAWPWGSEPSWPGPAVSRPLLGLPGAAGAPGAF